MPSGDEFGTDRRAGLHAGQGGAEVAFRIPQKAAPVKSRRGPLLFFCSPCGFPKRSEDGLHRPGEFRASLQPVSSLPPYLGIPLRLPSTPCFPRTGPICCSSPHISRRRTNGQTTPLQGVGVDHHRPHVLVTCQRLDAVANAQRPVIESSWFLLSPGRFPKNFQTFGRVLQ